jgi:hypothetical protein
MLRASVSLLGIAALLLFPGFATTAPASGLRGTVVVDPSRPVCIQGRPCSAPAPGVVLRFSRNDRVVARTRTRADGTYRVTLAPGRYVVSLAAARAPTTIVPHTVRVAAGRMTLRDFTVDTGIQ